MQEGSLETNNGNEAPPTVSRQGNAANLSDGESDDISEDGNEYKLSIHIPGWSYSSKQAAKDAFAEGELCSKYCFTKVGG